MLYNKKHKWFNKKINKMKKNYKNETPFTLTISHYGKPIVVRGFSTEQFNSDVKKSVDLNDIMDHLVSIIQNEFKNKDLEYIYDKYDLRLDDFLSKWKSERKSSKSYKLSDSQA